MKDKRGTKKDLELDFISGVFGIKLVKRGENDRHIIIEFFSEDDEYYTLRHSFSSVWLRPLINLLTKVQNYLDNSKSIKKEKGKWGGYRF